MKLCCVNVTVYFSTGELRVEAGVSAEQANSPSQCLALDPNELHKIPIVAEVLGKLKAALEDPTGDGIEMAVSNGYLQHTAAARSVPAGLGAPAPIAGGTVDLNRASNEQLQNLPGVGPETARRIVEARPFHSVDDLRGVFGIGEARFAVLRALVRVGPT
jgi:hypothetical protein